MSKKGKRDADRRKRIQAAASRRIDQQNRDHPREFQAAGNQALTITAEANDSGGTPKLATFSGIGYTGQPMTPQGWSTPLVVDLDGVVIPSQHSPVLRQHDHEQIVGHTTSVKVTSAGIEYEGILSGEPSHVSKVAHPAKNGFQWQLSIGADPDPGQMEFFDRGETVKVNGREWSGPLQVSRKTTLGEISFVPLGADRLTSASISASAKKGNSMNKILLKAAMAQLRASGKIKAAKFEDADIDAMDEETAKANLKKCMKAEDDPPGKSADDEEDDEDDKDKKAESAMRKFRLEMKASHEAAMAELRTGRAAEMARQAAIQSAVDRHGIRGMIPLVERGQPVKDANGQPVMVDLAAHAIKSNWTEQQTADAAELYVLRNSRPGAGVGVVPGGHLHIGSDPVMNGQVLECAVFDALRGNFKLFDDDFYRIGDADGKRRVSAAEQKRIQADLNARYPDQIRQAAWTRFKGQMGLKQLLAICASGGGYRGSENFGAGDWGTVADHLAESSRPSSIRADGPSSVNTPATLANVQNKFVLQGYLFTEQVFAEIASVLPVKDLKPTKSVQLFGDFQFAGLNPGGEIQHASIGDNPYANQAKIIARMITLELQYIINDDLGMFGQVPMMLGRGWGLKVNDLFWTAFMNPGYDEGGVTDFYAATHTVTGQSGNSNLSTGATTTLTSEGLRLANILFANQVDPAGKPLGVDPELLVYPPELDNAALELMNAQFIVMAGLASTAAASKQPNTNIWKGRYKPLMSRYLNKAAYTGYSTAKWYLLANPSVIPVIQIAALNGQMTPTIQTAGQDWQFNQLGMSMRGWGGVGVSPQNYRGAVRSNGA